MDGGCTVERTGAQRVPVRRVYSHRLVAVARSLAPGQVSFGVQVEPLAA